MDFRNMVFASLFAALMCVGGYIHIPIGPVPIVLTNFFVVLSGLLLGATWGALSVVIYLVLGAMGLPVFAGGKGGLAHIVGPTGGYLIGFVIASWIAGLVSSVAHVTKPFLKYVVSAVLGMLVVYVPGLLWLHVVTEMSWIKTLMVGCVPFLFGDLVKAVFSAVVAVELRPVIVSKGVVNI